MLLILVHWWEKNHIFARSLRTMLSKWRANETQTCICTQSRCMHDKTLHNESKKQYWQNFWGKVSWRLICSTLPKIKSNTCQDRSRQHSQPIRTAVAMVATVFGASPRFNMCPDIWFRSSTTYLNMKGTVTLVIWRTSREKERLRWACQMFFLLPECTDGPCASSCRHSSKWVAWCITNGIEMVIKDN